MKLKEAQVRVRQNGKFFSSVLVVALLLVAAGTLTAQEVRYNFMPKIDFSKYRTYRWVNIGGTHPDQIMDAEIKQALDSQLASKRMTETERQAGSPYRPPDCRRSGNTMGCLELTSLRHGHGIVDEFDDQCRDSGY